MLRESKTVHSLWWQAALAGAVLLLIAFGLWFFIAQQEQQENNLGAHLNAIAELKILQIVSWRQERTNDAAMLMEQDHLLEFIDRYLTTNDPPLAAFILKRLRSIKERNQYSDILLVGLDKRVRLSLRHKKNADHEGYGAAMDRALASRTPTWTPVHSASEHPEPHLAILAPLFSPRDRHRSLGALILICDAEKFLYPLIQSWPTPSHTAETLFVRRDGNDVLFLNNLRHQPNTALTLRLPLTQKTLPAVMAVTGKRGFVTGRDYRGVEVAAVVQPIPDSPWYIVAKIDKKEAYAELRVRSIMTLMLMLITIGLVMVVGLVFRQRALKSHYRDLYHSESALTRAMQRHSITLQSIGDGVIATDDEGRVELMNRVAENLTGWQQGQAIGRPIAEVFHIIHEQSREPVENPVSRVLEEGEIVTLASHTLLVARDGREIPIADSGAPIRNTKDETIGVVLVFKDQTQERAYQKQIIESERKYRLISDNSVDVIWTLNQDLVFTYINPAVYALAGFTQEEWIGSRLQDHCDEAAFTQMSEIILEELAKGPRGKGVIFESTMLRKSGDPFPVEVRGKINFDEAGQPISLQGVTRDISERINAEKERQKLQEQLHQAQKIESVGRLAGGVAHDYNNILSVIIGYTELSLSQVEEESPLYENLQEVYQAAMRSKAITRQLLAFARKEAIVPELLDLNATVEGMLKMIRRLIGEDIDLVWLPGTGLWPVMMDPSQIDQILANLCVNARDAINNVGRVTIETTNRVVDGAYAASYGDYEPGEYVCLSVSDDGCGMTREMMRNIFEPFYTTKSVGKGTGLGLSTIYGIARQNSGFINVYSEPDTGTTFNVFLPRHEGTAAKQPAYDRKESAKGRGEQVLVVEDEPSILKLTTQMLTRLGYSVLTANSPAEALELARGYSGDISLLITDVIMPEMNGRQLAEQLQPIFPRLRHLFMSGYTADVIAKSGVVEAGFNFIQKPFSARDLAAKVSAILYDQAP